VHNHPSGDPNLSEENLELTEKLAKSGDELGMSVLDSAIIGSSDYWSWKEKG